MLLFTEWVYTLSTQKNDVRSNGMKVNDRVMTLADLYEKKSFFSDFVATDHGHLGFFFY